MDQKLVNLTIDIYKPPEIFDCYDTLVLSGGGMKGLCTLGALQWLLDSDYLLNIRNYIGTSIGAIICYLLIIGYSPMEVTALVCSKKITEKLSIIDFNAIIKGKSALDFSLLFNELEKATIDKVGTLFTMKNLYEQFHKKLVCVTYNVSDNQVEYISYENYPNIPCLTALRMSSNIPLIFEEFKYLGKFYIDGGIVDNFPFEYATMIGKNILGINLTSEIYLKPRSECDIKEYLYNMLNLCFKKKNINYDNTTHKIIDIEISHLNMISFNISTKEKLDLFSSGFTQISKKFFSD